MTHEEAGQVVAILRAHYPQWKATAETAKIWAECFLDLDYELVNAALRRLLLSSPREFPPPVAMIRAEAAKLVDPAISVSPEEAWAEVLRQVRRVGYCGAPLWSHPALAQAVEAMGWREICTSEEGDTGTRAHFFRVYAAHQNRRRENAILPPELRLELPRTEEPKRLETEEPRLRLVEKSEPIDKAKATEQVRDVMRKLFGAA